MRSLRLCVFKLGIIVGFSSFVLFPLAALANNNADPVNSSVSVSSSSIPADGATTATVSVNVKDSLKNNLSGDRITLTNTSNDPGLVINGGSVGATDYTAATDSHGNVTFTISSSNLSPGTDTLTATDISSNPSVILGSVRITFTASALAPKSGCSDPAPGSAPQLFSALSDGSNQITLAWTNAAGPVTHYLVAYGITSGQYIYGNPNVGNTTSYTVGSLAQGTTYYFAIRPVNGCRPGSFSNEIFAVAGDLTTPAPTQIEIPNSSLNPSPSTSPIRSTPTVTPTVNPIFEPTDTPTPTPGEAFASIKALSKVVIYVFISAVIIGFGFISWRKFRK